MTFRESLAISANTKKKLIFQADNVFGVSPKATIKYQMGISEKWRQEHRGKMLVGEKVWRSE